MPEFDDEEGDDEIQAVDAALGLFVLSDLVFVLESYFSCLVLRVIALEVPATSSERKVSFSQA